MRPRFRALILNSTEKPPSNVRATWTLETAELFEMGDDVFAGTRRGRRPNRHAAGRFAEDLARILVGALGHKPSAQGNDDVFEAPAIRLLWAGLSRQAAFDHAETPACRDRVGGGDVGRHVVGPMQCKARNLKGNQGLRAQPERRLEGRDGAENAVDRRA